jgi:hypothetical protein
MAGIDEEVAACQGYVDYRNSFARAFLHKLQVAEKFYPIPPTPDNQ